MNRTSKKALIIASFMTYTLSLVCCGNPKSSVTGHVDIYENFESEHVAPRTVRVWTPADYRSDLKYPVIYMHDGQNLFDDTITWNHQEWGVDECITELISKGEIKPCIVVGIDNISSIRYEEYYPSKICADVAPGTFPEEFTPLGDEYLRFIVEEVKPFVDSNYSTLTDRSDTFVMGSSCGGLISSYALCEYPEVFGGAACLSTHCSLMNPYTAVDQKPAADAYLKYLQANLPAGHTLYMDRGDCPIDSAYAEAQESINRMIATLGWDESSFMYRFFPGQSHSENDWRSRLDIPIRFILK